MAQTPEFKHYDRQHARATAVVQIEVTNEGGTACVAQGTVLIRDPKT